ncbi:MAG TPA: CHAT domain-containing tetratricopeptide repeat protein [Pirellulales bacterium]|jgi:CHAT domain-containing protein/Tfp pilus assembly protein PilF
MRRRNWWVVYLAIVLAISAAGGQLSNAAEDVAPAASTSGSNRQALVDKEKELMASLSALIAQKKPEEALPIAQEAVKVCRELFGNDDAETALAIHQLAYCYSCLRKYEQACQFNREALAIRRKVLGDKHAYTALSLQNLGNTLGRQQKFPEALECHKESLAIYEEVAGQKSIEVANEAQYIGNLLAKSENYAEARRYLERAVAIRTEVQGENHSDTIAAIKRLDYTRIHLDDSQAAVDRLKTANPKVTVGEDARNPVEVASLIERGDLMFQSRSYAAAREKYEAALALCNVKHPKPVTTALLQSNLSIVLSLLGDYGKARAYVEQGLASTIKAYGATSAEAAKAWSDQGTLQLNLREFAAARLSFERGLAATISLYGPRNAKTIYLRTSLASVYSAIGDQKSAGREFEEALQIQKEMGNPEDSDAAFLHYEYGGFLLDEREFERAREQLELSLALRRKLLGNRHRKTANALDSLGRAHSLMHDYAKAQACFEEELAIRRETASKDHPELINGLKNLGYALGCQSKYAEAIDSFQQALSLGKKQFGENDPDAVTTYLSLARFSAANEDWRGAVQYAERGRRAARRRTSATLATLSERDQLFYLKQHEFPAYYTSLALALQLRQNPSIAALSANWVLNGKALGQEVLAERTVRAREGSDPTLKEITKSLVQLRGERARLTFTGGADKAREEKLAKAEEDLSRRLARAGSQSLQASQWVDVNRVRGALAADEILVDIAWIRSENFKDPADGVRAVRYAAWIIPASGKGEVKLLDLGDADAIDKAVVAWRVAIKSVFVVDEQTGKLKPIDKRAIALSDLALRRLSQLVLQPIERELGVAKHLLISPDRGLWLVPWASLLASDGGFLVENYDITYLVSGRDLIVPKAKRPSNQPLIVANPNFDLPPEDARKIEQLVRAGSKVPGPAKTENVRLKPPTARLGQPLEEFAKQVQAVSPKLAAYTGKKVAVLERDRALEPLVKSVHGPQVLLLATHGFFEAPIRPESIATTTALGGLDQASQAPPDNPLLRCGVLLAGCNWRNSIKGDDGILTGMEILGLDLRGTELVVLSACDTGVGDVRTGEGVAGTRQAFQLAGAQAVVATLWPVLVDEANLQMSDFFAQLAAGRTKPAALRNAQLAAIKRLREKYQAAPPLIWAAFTITGKCG